MTWLPTHKWWAATVTAGGGLAVMLLTGDRSVSDPEVVACVTFVVQRAVAYLVPNEGGL